MAHEQQQTTCPGFKHSSAETPTTQEVCSLPANTVWSPRSQNGLPAAPSGRVLPTPATSCHEEAPKADTVSQLPLILPTTNNRFKGL